MTISANCVWECRTTGSDASGGAFVAGSGGVDCSQQNAAFASGTNLTVDGSTNTKVNPDGYTVVSGDVGNLIQITTTGTGAAFTVGFYQITGVTTGTSSTQRWTLDRSPAVVSSAGATWSMGGALATLVKLAGAMVASNKAFVKGGTYAQGSTATFGAVANPPSNSAMPTCITGYYLTRGDITVVAGGGYSNNGNRPLLQLSTNLVANVLVLTNAGWLIENLSLDCNNTSGNVNSSGIVAGSSDVQIQNVKVVNFGTRGLNVSGSNCNVSDCEVSGGTSGAQGGINAGNGASLVQRCNVHDNVCLGINTGGVCSFNRVVNNSGSGNDGITFGTGCTIVNNTVYGSGRHGLSALSANWFLISIRNNILAKNAGYGCVGNTGPGVPAGPWWDGNAYYSNTSGTRNNMDDTTVNPVNGVAPYTNVLDVILTADPFTNAAGGDFTLNNVAGGGAACRGAGTPGALPGVSQVGYLDMGCFQHQSQSGGYSRSRVVGGA